MNEKIDKVITPTDIANLKSAVDVLGAKLDGVRLTAKELRKGGWFLSKKSELLFKDTLRIAKQIFQSWMWQHLSAMCNCWMLFLTFKPKSGWLRHWWNTPTAGQ